MLDKVSVYYHQFTLAQALQKAAKKINPQQGEEAGNPWVALIMVIAILSLASLGLFWKLRKSRI